MSRRKIIEETADDAIEEADAVMRWSPKKIVIATFVVICLIAGGLYAISLLSQNPSTKVLGQQTKDEPKIKIPNEKNVEEIIDSAQKELENINAKNIVSSQPKLQQIINDLTSLTSSSTSAKDLICNAVCK